jgi:hypothetical protein
MDLIRQNKFVSWVIAILVLLNLVSIVMLWSGGRPFREKPPRGQEQDGSAKLLQEEIGFSPEQASRYDALRRSQQEASRPLNDSLNALKLQIAEEVFAARPDDGKVDSMSARIGALQARVEVIRYGFFRELVQLCDSAQRQKLFPILKDVFGRKPPRDRMADDLRPKQNEGNGRKKRTDDVRPPRPDREPRIDKAPDRNGNPPPPRDDRQPPSIEEKLSRYAERLSLTPEQIARVRSVLQQSHVRGDQRKGPNKDARETRESVRDEEDQGIMKILTPSQQEEFTKMISKRAERPLREERQ